MKRIIILGVNLLCLCTVVGCGGSRLVTPAPLAEVNRSVSAETLQPKPARAGGQPSLVGDWVGRATVRRGRERCRLTLSANFSADGRVNVGAAVECLGSIADGRARGTYTVEGRRVTIHLTFPEEERIVGRLNQRGNRLQLELDLFGGFDGTLKKIRGSGG